MNERHGSRVGRCFERTCKVTAQHPWQTEVLCDSVEIRWIPESPVAGEYLMRLPLFGVDGVSEGAGIEAELGVWLGVKDRLIDEIKRLAMQWFSEHRELTNCTSGTKSDVTIVVGPSLTLVTGEEINEACTVPHFDAAQKRFRFLVCIQLPQPSRSARMERQWLRSALVHELEHIWQFIALNDTLMEAHWKVLAEMCAVYAETVRCPSSLSYLDFGANFLRYLPCGITRVDGRSSRIPQPYWTFPFMAHLSLLAPVLHRDVWNRPGMRAPDEGDALRRGPWVGLDAILRMQGTTLRDQWIAFCEGLLGPATGTAATIAKRFAPRLPTLRVDLGANATPVSIDWQWKTRPLSAHWIQLTLPGGTPWRLSWQSIGFSMADIVVVAKPQGGEWLEVVGERLVRGSETAIWDVLIIDATMIDTSDVMAVSHHLSNPFDNINVKLTREA